MREEQNKERKPKRISRLENLNRVLQLGQKNPDPKTRLLVKVFGNQPPTKRP